MVPKTGSRLPKSQISVSDSELANAMANALKLELGGSHRSTKTVMKWTNVSERTARSWLNGQTSPSSVHLLMLSAHCGSVLKAVLKLAGYDNVALAFDLLAVKNAMEQTLQSVEELIAKGE